MMQTSSLYPSQPARETGIICKICEKQYAKYTCPRCNLRYCSLACYKGHSLRCTEEFMRENVMEELHDTQATKEVKRKTIEMLKRLHFDEAGRSILEDDSQGTDERADDDSDDDEETIFSGRTLQLISEGGELTLDKLQEKERKAFMRSLAAGEVSHLIQPWNPWWLNPLTRNISITKVGTRLVEPAHLPVAGNTGRPELSRSDELHVDADADALPLPPSEPLISVRQLTQKDPSPLLPVHLAEMVYAYCFTMRYYNGDWLSEPLEATSAFLTVSHTMGEAALPESVSVAMTESLKTVCSSTFKHAGGLSFGVALIDDCATVLQLGRACIICVLADLHRMFGHAKAELNSELGPRKRRYTGPRNELKGSNIPGFSDPKPTTRPAAMTSRDVIDLKPGSRKDSRKEELRKIVAGMKKLYFLMCWTNEQVEEVFSSLAVLVEAEKARVLETRAPDTAEPAGLKPVKPVTRRPLIEEIF